MLILAIFANVLAVSMEKRVFGFPYSAVFTDAAHYIHFRLSKYTFNYKSLKTQIIRSRFA